MKKILSIFLILLFSFNAEAKIRNNINENSNSYKLLKLYLNKNPNKNNLKLYNDFSNQLERIDIIYPENENEITDSIVRAKNLLNQAGKNETIKDVLDVIDDIGQSLIIYVGDTKNQKINEYLAAYITLRKNGYSILEAKLSLKDLIKSLSKK